MPAQPRRPTRDRQPGCRCRHTPPGPRTADRQHSTQPGSQNNPSCTPCTATPPGKPKRSLPSELANTLRNLWRRTGRRSRPAARTHRRRQSANRLGNRPLHERTHRHTSSVAHHASPLPAPRRQATAPGGVEQLPPQTPPRRCLPTRGRRLAAHRWRSPSPHASLTATGRCRPGRFAQPRARAQSRKTGGNTC